ncbi:Uncharacterised protein [Legionella sainthelensi]|uniref:hypothetical protein n=1 Tax=Legionella sainthelensi TaxID=28087 RepID=UPI000F6EB403|nr:hypothetical protein [Legionella sainthelensi]VEB35378.1 Uncharacterised protein [Legionella sainthelensi]
MRQSFYLANDKYHEIIGHFSRFNEMKKTLKDEEPVVSILTYFEKYMPVALEKIDKQPGFINQTLNSCDELLKKPGNRELKNYFKHKPKSRPTNFGNIVELSRFPNLAQLPLL